MPPSAMRVYSVPELITPCPICKAAKNFLAACLSPIYEIINALRAAAYRNGLCRVQRLPVAVIVVGNLTAGGSGKTPVVIALAQALRAAGRCPGIISRGYRGRYQNTAAVTTSDATQFGDEPVLMAQRTACPVVVGRDRVAAATALLAAYPQCDLILSDDGLQHYRLGRDVELVVMDSEGQAYGRLRREGLSRLRHADAVVCHEGVKQFPDALDIQRFSLRLVAQPWYALHDPNMQLSSKNLQAMAKPLHAVAGIGVPERFFATLRNMGLSFHAHAFPDHHHYCSADLDWGEGIILTTEKDAVKLRALPYSAQRSTIWVLPVSAQITPDLAAFILEKMNGRTFT